MKILSLIIPCFILLIIVFALKEKQDVLKLFTDGVTEGLRTTIKIFPHILAITVAISLINETKTLEAIIKPIKPILMNFNIPEGVIPLAIFRPMSGGASMSVVMDIFKNYGPDSIEGKIASIIMGGTETTFYVITLLFGVVGIKKMRGTLIAALIADIFAITTAIILVNLKII